MKTLNTEEGKVLQITGLKGKDVKRLTKLQLAIQKASGETEQINASEAYMNALDEIAARICGLSVEQLDELESTDKNKIIAHISEQAQDSLGFGKPSTK